MLRLLSLSGGRHPSTFCLPTPAFETQPLHVYLELRTLKLWRSGLLQGMEYPLAEQRKIRLPIPLSFDQFELGDMPFDHAVVDPPS